MAVCYGPDSEATRLGGTRTRRRAHAEALAPGGDRDRTQRRAHAVAGARGRPCKILVRSVDLTRCIICMEHDSLQRRPRPI